MTGATSCLICGEKVFVDSRGVCERHSQKIYDFYRTRHFQVKDGRTKAEKLLRLARDILLEKGEISGLLLRRVLQINEKVARATMVLLEKEGLIKAPARSRVARLIENPEKGVTVKKRLPKALSPQAKSVEDLVAVVGEDSDLAKVLRSLAVDSAKLRRLKTRLKNVLGDDGPPTKKAS